MSVPLSLPTSPDAQSAARSPILGLSLSTAEKGQEVNPEALAALETYKARDSTKGISNIHSIQQCITI